jgi:recombination protein RecA
LRASLGHGSLGRAKPLTGLTVGIGSIDRALPHGLPGGVVEICAPAGLGQATQLSAALLVQAQRRGLGGLRRREESAWVAWIDPAATLYAPGLAQAGLDLERLLVARPEADDIARTAVKLAQSHLFAALVVDRSGLPGAAIASTRTRWNTAVRRLALAAEESDITIVLLSTTSQASRDPLPTAMRLELSRCSRDRLRVAVTKDRRGHLPSPFSVPLRELAS